MCSHWFVKPKCYFDDMIGLAKKIVILLLVLAGTNTLAQKAVSPYLGEAIHSPYEFNKKQAANLEHLCDSLEKKGVRDSSYLMPLLELITKYTSLDPLSAMNYAVKGAKISEEKGWWQMASLFHTARGNILRIRGYRDLALAAFQQSYAHREKQQNPDLFVFGLIDIGNIYFDQRNFPKAFELYSAAYDTAMQKDYAFGAAVALNNFGILYRELGIYSLAEHMFNRSATLRLNAGLYGLTAHSKNYIAGLRFREGRFEEGLVIVRDVIDTMRKYDMFSELADIYCGEARFLQALGRKEAADSAMARSWEILMRNNMLDRLDFHYMVQAEIAVQRGEYVKAEAIYQKLIQLAQDIDNVQGIMRAHELRYQMFKKAGKWQEALVAFEKYVDASKSIEKQEVDRKLLEMENQRKLRKDKAEIEFERASLEQREQLLEARQLKNRLLLTLALVSLFGILLVTLMWLKQRRTNKQLRNSQQVIEQQNRQMHDQNLALKRAKELAEKHLRAKTDFMSHMSHEIRTPMNSILSLTELLEQEIKDADALDKLQSIRYSADILLVIINDILDLASIEEGKIHLDRTPVSLERITQEINKLLKPKTKERGINFLIKLDPEIPELILSDATRLFQILLNLAGNAVKFTHQGQVSIHIKNLDKSGDHCKLHFEVMDTGVGIQPDVLPYIFDSFSQGGSNIQKKCGGTGLGLTITKKLVELLGGKIHVRSTPNVGSAFWFDLQFAIPTESDMPVMNATIMSIQDLSKLRVLYVEDNVMNQKVMNLLLRPYKLEPSIANNGKEALDMLEKNKYDVILMDFRMPVMDGFMATQHIRDPKSPYYQPNLPIIGVTADVFDESTQKALAVGMNDILVKPLVKEKLIESLLKYGKELVQSEDGSKP